MDDISRVCHTILDELSSLEEDAATDSKPNSFVPCFSYAKIDKVTDTENQQRLLFVFRGAYVPLFKSRRELTDYCSYFSPMGQAAAQDIGQMLKLSRPTHTHVSVVEKCTFIPRRGATWDARNAKVHLASGATQYLASMRQRIESSDGAMQEDWKERPTVDRFELPDQMILDSLQDGIFRLPLNSRITITGRPGTGKTTTLLKRIAFKSYTEYLSDDERQLMKTSGLGFSDPWILFAPSAIAKNYVWNALRAEIPQANKANIVTWSEERARLFQLLLQVDSSLSANINGALDQPDPFISYTGGEMRKYFDGLWERWHSKVGKGKFGESKFSFLPEMYKEYRKGTACGHLTISELEILLLIILRTANKIFRNDPKLLSTPQKSILETIKRHYRLQVAIDEAADFSRIQLGCMTFLAHPLVNSVTLAGDLMQRTTENGIEDWNEVSSSGEAFREYRLKKVYRQNPKLANVCARLYSFVYGKVESLTRTLPSDSKAPAPLRFRHTDQLADWILSRVNEIRTLTKGETPSIGIFAADSMAAEQLYQSLSPYFRLNGLSLEVQSNEITAAEADRVRIFSLDSIKGLEFEAVILFDINAMSKLYGYLFLRYFYVAVTRAATFVAVTHSSSWPEMLNEVKSDFQESQWVL